MSVREKQYADMLESLNDMRSGIANECTQSLMTTGSISEVATRELKCLNNIMGAFGTNLEDLGYPVTDGENNTSVINIDGRSFNFPRITVTVKSPVKEEVNSFPESKPVTENTAEKPVISETVETPVEEIPVPVKPETEDIVNESAEEPVVALKPVVETVTEPIEEETPESLDDNTEETPEKTVADPIAPAPEPTPEPVQEKEDEAKEEPFTIPAPKVFVPEPPKTSEQGGANIIGGNVSNVSAGFDKSDFFMEEQDKDINEFIYCYSKIAVCHTDMGGGGRPEEMLVLVAPLKIHKYECSSVPIVVTIVHNGKSITKSSYDILEEGKNIVTIDIDEFYFLCRGSFDANGKFKASIVTTGISSQQNDKISVIFSKSYGNGSVKETRNGHIKFRYTADSGPGTIEIFPFDKPEERSEDFVAIVKNKEFVDYYLVSKTLKANARAIVYSEGGVMNELICHWDGDRLCADMV